MTRIRRITVSQIEGNSANENITNEIQPFGETGFYIDQSGTDKLTLLMFDGKRTNLKSKVLAPGRLYGSDADSGDGNLNDTIKLIPDSQLYSQGSDQYLVVDPTIGGPAHIHLRAGGVQDNSNADLYIGGERTHVRVSDSTDDVVIKTTLAGEGEIARTWTFSTNGDLTFPDNTTQTTAWLGIPGPYADDVEAAAEGVAIGNPYHKTGTSGQVFVRLT